MSVLGSKAARWGGGFSLVELLLVIAVIAVLIGLVLPALGRARRVARETQCMSNQRQLGVAWAAYSVDFRGFPVGQGNTWNTLRYGWGGVDWYAPSGGTLTAYQLFASRPINAYVSSSDTINFRAGVFKCPLDISCRYWNGGARDLDQVGAAAGCTSGELDTCFGVLGLSYYANTYMYWKPGLLGGTPGPPGHGTRLSQGPQHVYIAPSKFVVLMDTGPANWIVSDTQTRALWDFWGEWWHGQERTIMCFLDGSVRPEKSGRLVCERYSFHLKPLVPSYANLGWNWPDHP